MKEITEIFELKDKEDTVYLVSGPETLTGEDMRVFAKNIKKEWGRAFDNAEVVVFNSIEGIVPFGEGDIETMKENND